MLAIQYDLFGNNTDISLVRKEILDLKKSTENLRRGLFSRHSELMKMYLDQQDEIERLRSMIIETHKG